MIGWIAAHEFTGCRFTLLRQYASKGGANVLAVPAAEILDILSDEGRILVLVGEAPANALDEDGNPVELSIRDATSKSLINLYSVVSTLVVSRDRCGYASVFSCYASPNDSDLDLLNRDGIDVMDQACAIEMIKNVGEDPLLVEEALDLSYADAYMSAVDWINKYVVMGLSGVDPTRRSHIGARPSSAALVDFKDGASLIFGLVDKPEMRDGWSRKSLGLDAARMNMVVGAHPEHRAREREILCSLQEAWANASVGLSDVFWECFPDKSRRDSVSAEEIIEAMCLEHAADAFAAGVPIEDIIC